nr:MAG TPA: protein of unknown function DUF859 [Caudoviricetes sp.]
MAELVKNYSNGSSIKVVYSYTQNVSKNQSTITMTLYVHRDSYGPSWNTKCDAYIQLDGSKVMTYDGSFNIGTSWVKIGSTVSKTVTHNADGTKTISLKGFFDSLGLTSKLDDLTVSGNVTLKTIPRASSFTLSTSTVTAGSTSMTVNITRASSSFTHTVRWKLGSHTKSTTGVGSSASYTIPESWLDAIPNSTSGTGTVTVTTYNGSTKIGSTSKSFTVKAASDVVPSFTGITFTRVDGDVPADWGIYVRTKSKVTAKITGAAGVYGSTIKSYSISGSGYSGTAASLTTGFLNTAGTVTFTAKITDSRGRTATKTASVTVTDYTPPVLSSVAGFRCDSAGTEQDDGNYISLTANFSGSVLGGKNPVTGEYRYKAEGGDWSGFSPLVSGEPAVFAATGDATFTVQVQVSDTFSSFTQDIVVNSIRFIMDFKAGGTGIAFGKAAEYDDTLDCNWDGHFRKNVRIDGSAQTGGALGAGTAAGETGLRVNRKIEFMAPTDTDTPSASMTHDNDRGLYFTVQNGVGQQAVLHWFGEDSADGRHILRCTENGLAYLGTTTARWNTGFFTNTITQSDLKDKENIREISGAKGFIMALQPIAYTLKDGDGGRVHMGFGAQQVAQAAAEHGMGDLSLYQAVVVEPDGSERYFREGVQDENLCWGLNYHEFLAPLIALVQEQETRIQQLEEQLDKIQKG